MLNKNKVGLHLGILFVIIHLVWSLAVLIMPGALQKFLDWIFTLHSIKPFYVILPFNLLNSIMLLIVTFVIGYIIGFVFGAIAKWVKH